MKYYKNIIINNLLIINHIFFGMKIALIIINSAEILLKNE